MKIFISYRREDSAPTTGRIDDRLVAAFGRNNVYKDVDSVPLGIDFRQHIKNAVSECDLLLAVIGESWLKADDGSGRLRLEDPSDWVRIEVETALERNIPVIPILLGRTRMPRVEELPQSIKELAFRNAIQVRWDPDFHRDLDRLVEGMKRYEQDRTKVAGSSRVGRGAPIRVVTAVIMTLLVLISVSLGIKYWPTGGPEPKVEAGQKAQIAKNGDSPAAPDSEAPTPPGSIAPAPPTVAPASAAAGEITALFAKMAAIRSDKPNDVIGVGLWIASPIDARDLPVFEDLAKSMQESGARLVELSHPKKLDLEVARSEYTEYNDPRRMLDSKLSDVVICYGFTETDAEFPDVLLASTKALKQRVHLALVWACQAGKDCFLILPRGRPSAWVPARLGQEEVVPDDDAVSASMKYRRIVWMTAEKTGNDFRGFFKSVKSRELGADHIRNILKPIE